MEKVEKREATTPVNSVAGSFIPYLTDECGVQGLYLLYLVQQAHVKHKGNGEYIFNSGSRDFFHGRNL